MQAEEGEMPKLGMLAIALLALLGGPALAQQVPQSRAQIQLSFAPVVKQTAPAVVNVYARRVVRQPGIPGFSDDPFFRRFFGDGGVFGRSREMVQNSLGSGVLVDPSGIVVTNNHVIQGGTEIRVVLSDRREFDATVTLADEHSDLAILKVNAGQAKLPSLPLGDSDNLEVGDLVLAIGNPFGVGQTVTSGIVSALARTEVGITDYQFFIQTDAAINPGNSGGALIDLAGRLIGINTAIYSRSGGSIGIGFAIPANMVRTVVASAMNGGKVSRPWGGADLQDVTAEMGETLGLDRPRGAIVASLHPLSPMVEAGIATGDIIVGVNGKPVENAKEFDYRLATLSVGQRTDVDLIRKGKPLTAKLALVRAPDKPAREETQIKGRTPLTGAVVANVSPALADELGLGISAKGVAVVAVKGGPAAEIGFRKGDILLEVNGEKVSNVKTLQAALTKENAYWELSIDRGGQVRSVRLGG
jgi:Do/DeqQ family serine protease